MKKYIAVITGLLFAFLIFSDVGFTTNDNPEQEARGINKRKTPSKDKVQSSKHKSNGKNESAGKENQLIKKKRKYSDPSTELESSSNSSSSSSSSSNSSSSSSSSASSGPKNDVFYDKYLKIMSEKEAYLITSPIQYITAQDEDREGSRKWVRFLDSTEDSIVHEWHKQMSGVVKALRDINNREKYLPAEVNFAVARLTFHLKDESLQEEPLPFFFVSGWPANNHKNPIIKFSQKISTGKLGKILDNYKEYSLRFITLSYNNGEQQKILQSRNYTPFRESLIEIMQKALTSKDHLIGEVRLQSHIQLLSKDAESDILAKLYFHTEQSLWPCILEKIKEFRKSYQKKSKGDIRSHLGAVAADPIGHVIVDLCSYYDMCWCCGDTLVSCCHAKQEEPRVFIRASGCTAYYDIPFAKRVNPPYALREHRKEFKGFQNGKAYTINGRDSRPYIAHAMREDF